MTASTRDLYRMHRAAARRYSRVVNAAIHEALRLQRSGIPIETTLKALTGDARRTLEKRERAYLERTSPNREQTMTELYRALFGEPIPLATLVGDRSIPLAPFASEGIRTGRIQCSKPNPTNTPKVLDGE